MKINPKVLAELAPTYGVAPIDAMKGAKQIMKSGQTLKAPAGYEPILVGNGYEWDEEHACYIMEDQAIYYLPNKLFLWCWQDSLVRLFDSASKLQKWVQGDEKYPQGKANAFMGIYKEMTGQEVGSGGTAVAPPDEEHNQDEPIPMDRAFADEPTNPVFKGMGARAASVPDSKPMDKVDMLIAQAKKKMGKAGTLPSDDILDLYNQSKELKSNKLLAFIKTIKPLGEGFVKKSALDEIIRQIVKTIVQESGDDSSRWESPSPKGWEKGRKGGDKGGWEMDAEVPNNDDQTVLDIATKAFGKPEGRSRYSVLKDKSSPDGKVFQVSISVGDQRVQKSYFIWKTNDGSWKYLDPRTRKWQPVLDENPSEQLTPTGGMEEETATGAVAPIATPFAFKKKVTSESMDLAEREKIKAAIKILMSGGGDKNSAKLFLKQIGFSDEKIASLDKSNGLEVPLEEMTTTSEGGGSSAGTTGYNIPGAFSKKGGSEAGVEGSESLGYTLTGIGKKDMQRHADRLLSESNLIDPSTWTPDEREALKILAAYFGTAYALETLGNATVNIRTAIVNRSKLLKSGKESLDQFRAWLKSILTKKINEGEEADAMHDTYSDHEADHYEKHYGSPKPKKVNTQKKQTTPKKTIGGTAKVKGKVIHLDEGIVSGFVDLLKRAALKLGVEMFQTPEEIQQANQIYSKVKEYLRSNKESGKVPSKTEMENFFNGMIAAYDMPQDRKQIYWNALTTLRGHMIHRSGGLYGSR